MHLVEVRAKIFIAAFLQKRRSGKVAGIALTEHRTEPTDCERVRPVTRGKFPDAPHFSYQPFSQALLITLSDWCSQDLKIGMK